MSIFREFAELMWDYMEIRNKEEREARIAYERRMEEKRKKKREEEELKRKREEELNALANKEMRKNPDHWQILPYGWSPFGIFL